MTDQPIDAILEAWKPYDPPAWALNAPSPRPASPVTCSAHRWVTVCADCGLRPDLMLNPWVGSRDLDYSGIREACWTEGDDND